MKVLLTRMRSTNHNLRTNTVEGTCNRLPTVGQPFLMFSEPFNKGHEGTHIRIIETSVVKLVHEELDDSVKFETENSLYNLIILEDV